MKEGGSQSQQNLRLLDLFLRLTVLPFSVASIWVMVKTNEASESYGKIDFSNLSGLKYLVWISSISAVYALVSALITYLGLLSCDWAFFVLDQVTAYLMVTSGSAVMEILYLAHEGDREVSWSAVCSYFGKFCSEATVSLVLQFVGLVCFLVLSLVSGYRLFSKFDAPSLASSSKEEVSRELGIQGGIDYGEQLYDGCI